MQAFPATDGSNRMGLQKPARYCLVGGSIRSHPERARRVQEALGFLAREILISEFIERHRAPGRKRLDDVMIRKDDPLLKRLADDTVKSMIKSGEMNKLWTKWFLSPIPPKNTKVGLALSASTKAAWDNPNDKPMEEYAQK